MKPRLRTVRDERGVALPLALFALVMLSGLLLVFLSMAGMEPSIATNLSDVTRARNLAEAGIEWAFDALAAAPNLNGLLTTNGGVMAIHSRFLPRVELTAILVR
jgi:Tfp pilus assembly protein PilX